MDRFYLFMQENETSKWINSWTVRVDPILESTSFYQMSLLPAIQDKISESLNIRLEAAVEDKKFRMP